MSFTDPAFDIPRRVIDQPAGVAGAWEKMSPMFPQATASPPTPERLDLLNLPAGVRANPVPSVMAAAGFLKKVSTPFTIQRDLMHGATITMWDGKPVTFFLFRDKDNPVAKMGTYPAETVRVPRGAVFHSGTQGHGPPPHTIHWHGIEPTSLNDGVGHCSMEIGKYVFQWQPNFIGTYFYHCHRNTTQHFEFGLFGLMVFDPPDAFFASIASIDARGIATLNDIPIGNGNPEPGFPLGRRRTAANLVTPVADFTAMFPGFVAGGPAPDFGFLTDPHAFTVPYDVEVFWVLDDRDSIWSDFAPSPFAFFPRNGNRPGVNDRFARGFFNDFRADYWFVTGVPSVPFATNPAAPPPPGVTGLTRGPGFTGRIDPAAPPPVGGIGGIAVPDGLVPPELNGGIFGTQIAVNAQQGQTIFIRCLDAAYNTTRVTFPVDVVIIEFDGRALGVPPFGFYNNAFLLPARTPIIICTARRFGALVPPTAPAVDDFAVIEFLDSQGAVVPGAPVPAGDLPVPLGPVLHVTQIPFKITAPPAPPA